MLEKLTGQKSTEKPTVNLPAETIFVQDVQLGDYIQEERVNVNSSRGYKSVMVRIPMPDDALKESMKLEVEKNAVKFSCETPLRRFKTEKSFKFELV